MLFNKKSPSFTDRLFYLLVQIISINFGIFYIRSFFLKRLLFRKKQLFLEIASFDLLIIRYIDHLPSTHDPPASSIS